MIVSRPTWGAKSPLPATRMTLPARAVFLHHTVTAVTTNPGHDMRVVEKVGVSRFGYVSYSYCIHPDGTILEGCGLRRGAHTAGRNSTAFGVALIGNYEERNVTAWQLGAFRWLAAHLVDAGWLRRGTYPTGGHRDVASTACPGTKAYRLLDQFRQPWTEPVAAAPAVTATPYPGGEAMLTRLDIDFPALDNEGRGWARLDVPATRVVSMVCNGPYPPVDGYWEMPILARQDRDGATIVSVTEGRPGAALQVAVWVVA